MIPQILVIGLVSIGAVLAHPTENPTRTIVKRATPSQYPTSPSDSPFINEPQYLNFDFTEATETTNAANLHSAFGNEWNLLMFFSLPVITQTDRTIFARFFEDGPDPEGEEPPQTETVTAVYNLLWNQTADGGDGAAMPLVASFIFDNEDFMTMCPETSGSVLCEDCDTALIGAYTDTDPADGLEKTHFCNVAFDYEPLNEIDCDTLDSYPSVQMENLGRIMHHEFFHYAAVGKGVEAIDATIPDATNADGLAAYGAARTHALAPTGQDDNPALCIGNADNYAWFAVNSWFTSTCVAMGTPPANNGQFDDPPEYTEGESGDPSDNGFGDNPSDNGCGSELSSVCS